jgi:streptogramin lyase
VSRTARILALPLALAALVLPAAADARPRLAGTFDLSGRPGQITNGPDGNIWVVLLDSDDSNTLARIRPNGNVTEYQPDAVVNPIGITTGQDGNLWLTRNGGVIKVPPGNPDNAVDFDIDDMQGGQAITKGPRRRLWTGSEDELISFRPNDPSGYDHETIDGMSARAITSSGGKLWLADFAGSRIIRYDPDGGAVKRYSVGGNPQGIARGPSKSVAYTNPGTDPQTIGRIDPPKKPRKTRVPMTDPFGITFAPDGRWWIASFLTGDLTLLDPDGDLRRFRALPNDSGPRQLTKGPNGTMWVSLELSEKVARIKGVTRR